MKNSAVIFGISALLATATAQSAALPACLQSCAQAIYAADGCTNGDFKCICTGSSKGGVPSFTGNGACATGSKTCSAADLKAWGAYWGNGCKPYIGNLAQTVASQAPSAIAAASTVLGLADGTSTTLATSPTGTVIFASSTGAGASNTAAASAAGPTVTNAAALLRMDGVSALAAAAALYLIV